MLCFDSVDYFFESVGIAGITVYNTIVKKHNRTSTDIKENDNETKS